MCRRAGVFLAQTALRRLPHSRIVATSLPRSSLKSSGDVHPSAVRNCAQWLSAFSLSHMLRAVSLVCCVNTMSSLSPVEGCTYMLHTLHAQHITARTHSTARTEHFCHMVLGMALVWSLSHVWPAYRLANLADPISLDLGAGCRETCRQCFLSMSRARH